MTILACSYVASQNFGNLVRAWFSQPIFVWRKHQNSCASTSHRTIAATVWNASSGSRLSWCQWNTIRMSWEYSNSLYDWNPSTEPASAGMTYLVASDCTSNISPQQVYKFYSENVCAYSERYSWQSYRSIIRSSLRGFTSIRVARSMIEKLHNTSLETCVELHRKCSFTSLDWDVNAILDTRLSMARLSRYV